MSNTFDPYQQWCGVPQQVTSPDHYLLLGLNRFEQDQTVIYEQFASLYGRIRSYQQGQRREQALQLLDEISAAYATLADQEAKQVYDQQLGGHDASTTEDPPTQKPAVKLRRAETSNLGELLRTLERFDSLSAFTFYDILGVAPSETRPQSLFHFYAGRSKLLALHHSDHPQRFRLIEEMQEALRWLSDNTRRQVYCDLYQQFPNASGDELTRRANARLFPRENPSTGQATPSVPTLATPPKPPGPFTNLTRAELLAIVLCTTTIIGVTVILYCIL